LYQLDESLAECKICGVEFFEFVRVLS